ncbi:MAG: hypothetical protein ACD_82C00152G0001, partial [uncultured bacterium]
MNEKNATIEAFIQESNNVLIELKKNKLVSDKQQQLTLSQLVALKKIKNGELKDLKQVREVKLVFFDNFSIKELIDKNIINYQQVFNITSPAQMDALCDLRIQYFLKVELISFEQLINIVNDNQLDDFKKLSDKCKSNEEKIQKIEQLKNFGKKYNISLFSQDRIIKLLENNIIGIDTIFNDFLLKNSVVQNSLVLELLENKIINLEQLVDLKQDQIDVLKKEPILQSLINLQYINLKQFKLIIKDANSMKAIKDFFEMPFKGENEEKWLMKKLYEVIDKYNITPFQNDLIKNLFTSKIIDRKRIITIIQDKLQFNAAKQCDLWALGLIASNIINFEQLMNIISANKLNELRQLAVPCKTNEERIQKSEQLKQIGEKYNISIFKQDKIIALLKNGNIQTSDIFASSLSKISKLL